MAFLRDPHGKQVFTTSGTWTHPTPGANLQVTLTLVGGGGGGQGSTNGGNGGDTTATPTGGDTTTAKGGAGGGQPTVAGAGRKIGASSVAGASSVTGPAGVGIYGMNGVAPNSPWNHGQCGGVTVLTITTAVDIALVIGAGGTAGTGAEAGESGLAIVEW